jgi:prefoldin subunit 5
VLAIARKPSSSGRLVNIGNQVFVQALPDPAGSRFLHVGFGFHVDLKPDEVEEFVPHRQKLLGQKINLMDKKLLEVAIDYEQVSRGLCRFPSYFSRLLMFHAPKAKEMLMMLGGSTK